MAKIKKPWRLRFGYTPVFFCSIMAFTESQLKLPGGDSLQLWQSESGQAVLK